MAKKILIVGGSSGIGLELVKLYLENEDQLYVSARNASKNPQLQSLKSTYGTSLSLYDNDVTQTKEVNEFIQMLWSDSSGLDLCIYNAGVYESMKLSEWDMEKFEAMNNVNYLGGVRFITAVTPYFVSQKKGHIVCNLSISSYFGLPNGGGYSAPKAGLLNFCESIQPELSLNNIHMQVINHGFVKTRLTDKNDFEMPQLLEPVDAAQKIFEGIKNPNKFEIRFPFALSMFLNMLRMLPYKISLAMTKKAL